MRVSGRAKVEGLAELLQVRVCVSRHEFRRAIAEFEACSCWAFLLVSSVDADSSPVIVFVDSACALPYKTRISILAQHACWVTSTRLDELEFIESLAVSRIGY